MIDRLRDLLDRPIGDAERRRLFALAALAVSVVGIALALAGRPGDTRHPAPPRRVAKPALPATQPLPASTPPSGTTAAAAQATEAVRHFLAGYLRYLYGHGPARAIESARPRLKRRLERERPRVSPATRHRDGRVVALDARRLPAGGRFAVTATIDDGSVARYPISLILEPHGAGFRVVEVSGE